MGLLQKYLASTPAFGCRVCQPSLHIHRSPGMSSFSCSVGTSGGLSHCKPTHPVVGGSSLSLGSQCLLGASGRTPPRSRTCTPSERSFRGETEDNKLGWHTDGCSSSPEWRQRSCVDVFLVDLLLPWPVVLVPPPLLSCLLLSKPPFDQQRGTHR